LQQKTFCWRVALGLFLLIFWWLAGVVLAAILVAAVVRVDLENCYPNRCLLALRIQ
jgi:hypothetical protein